MSEDAEAFKEYELRAAKRVPGYRKYQTRCQISWTCQKKNDSAKRKRDFGTY
jgi:hypothetical protein